MDPPPDFGYDSYKGSGKLKNKVGSSNTNRVLTSFSFICGLLPQVDKSTGTHARVITAARIPLQHFLVCWLISVLKTHDMWLLDNIMTKSSDCMLD